MRVSVVGAGYVGLVTGIGLAQRGYDVTFVETSAARRESLAKGILPISEPGLAEAFAAARDRVEVSDDIGSAPDSSLVVVCVGTPTTDEGEPDLSQLTSALRAICRRPDLHVVVRSTLPPGSSVRLPELLDRPNGARVSTHPEFLRQGTALADYAHPSRLVFGVFPETEAEHRDLVRQAFSHADTPVLEVSASAAEMIKNVANAFLALKLSFVNEVASLAEQYGVEVDEVLAGISLDPRIGSAYMRPGLGFGGSCLPKELQVLAAAGQREGLPMHVARAAARVNGDQQARFVKRILAELPSRGARIGLLGLAFKRDTDDVRGSPAVYVAKRLLEAGHDVAAYDPVVPPERVGLSGLRQVETPGAAFDGADAVVIATDWPEFASLDLAEMRGRMNTPLLFDGRNLLDRDRVVAAQISYRGVGRASGDPNP